MIRPPPDGKNAALQRRRFTVAPMRERRVTGTVATLAVLAALSACGAAEDDHVVARVYQPGYVFNTQLLRPARVVVKQWNG